VSTPTFIQNVTQLAKMGFDLPQNVKLFLQLDSIALNFTSSHPGNVTLTTPPINHIISVYNQMKNNNSTGGFTKIATVAMQALHPVSVQYSNHRDYAFNILRYVFSVYCTCTLDFFTSLWMKAPVLNLQ
jgi:hypothetical protein